MTPALVFISYSRADREVVAPLAELLRAGGAQVFRDEDNLTPGQPWQVVLTENLEAAQSVLVFWSGNAAQSLAVQQEYSTALSQGKDVVPVLLDDTPLVSELAAYHWVDLRSFVGPYPAPQPVPAPPNRVGGMLGLARAFLGAALSPVAGTATVGTALLTLGDVDRSRVLHLLAERLTRLR